jgi:hypothetical protein
MFTPPIWLYDCSKWPGRWVHIIRYAGSDSCDSDSDSDSDCESDSDCDSGWLWLNLRLCIMVAQNYKACEYITLRSAGFCLYVCGSDGYSYSDSDSDNDWDSYSDSDSDRDGDSVSPSLPIQFAFIMVKLVSTLV